MPLTDIDLIGGPLFPLGHPKKKVVFGPGRGKPIQDENLAALVRTIHKRDLFQVGECYNNVDILQKNLNANGWWKTTCFVGWMLSDFLPKNIHHAWLVFNGESVIDLGQFRFAREISNKLRPLHAKIKEEFTKAGKTETAFEIHWREIWCRELFAYEHGDVITNRVWGQVPEGFVYVGCPCTPDQGRLLYNNWFKKYGKETDTVPGQLTPTQVISLLVSKGLGSAQIQEAMRRIYGQPQAEEPLEEPVEPAPAEPPGEPPAGPPNGPVPGAHPPEAH